MKIDRRPAMGAVTEASGLPFIFLNFGIDTFCQSIADTMLCISDNK